MIFSAWAGVICVTLAVSFFRFGSLRPGSLSAGGRLARSVGRGDRRRIGFVRVVRSRCLRVALTRRVGPMPVSTGRCGRRNLSAGAHGLAPVAVIARGPIVAACVIARSAVALHRDLGRRAVTATVPVSRRLVLGNGSDTRALTVAEGRRICIERDFRGCCPVRDRVARRVDPGLDGRSRYPVGLPSIGRLHLSA